MRQLVFHGPGRLAVEEGEPPPLAAGEARVAVHSVGVCGSDVHGYAGLNSRRSPGMIMGHEAVGTVIELGAGVESPSVGTVVAVNPVVGCGECALCAAGDENLCERRGLYGCVPGLPGAFADQIAVRAENLVPLLGSVPVEWGALVEPLAVGSHAVRVGGEPVGQDVVVIGGGPIGIGAALAARRLGAAGAVVVEPSAHRRRVSERLGLRTVDPATSDVPRSAFRVAYECVGYSQTLAAAIGAVRPKGTVVFIGLAEETIELPATPLMVGERVIAGSSAYPMRDFRDVAGWVASGEVDLAPLIELRVGLDALPGVFDRYASGSLAAVKTLLRIGA